ncbi:SgrR family transcriptional regulator [Photobacterium aquimaris]|uniref:HTH-type transcriptional regulator SgrR n=1 Tax=Photobacterium aquimaris TaxID=512643 RepID=A0A1Y6KVB8_9GAMM|nr:SgrR family transcriptional regulator [Photobacterium aquimaris]SMY15982.1 HTH-type transcriptional regulator SgrR [Photobacterium aquimaris]
MSGQRLKLQFQRLYNHFGGDSIETNLQDIAEVLFCTRRNVRIVINKMVSEGWIDWQPAVGRGKQSRLIFNNTDSELQLNYARKLVAEGKLEPALVTLDHNAEKLVQLIQEQLGISHHQGKQIVRLPYYRSFENITPLKPLRRSEQHLVRQIFSGLTQLNEEKGEEETVVGDIAHTWEPITLRHWRFYLRPAIRFHDGRLLDSHDIFATFAKVKQLSLFAHIDEVTSPFSNIIDFHLSQDDYHFPDLLANINAMIQPANHASLTDYETFPIGTGPYKVVVNDKQRFKLEAFEQYFGFRALTDVVEVWILNNFAACYLQPTSSDTLEHNVHISSRLSMDQGCTFLLLNRISGLAQQADWLNYFQSRLYSLNVMREMDLTQVGDFKLFNAYGLLPGWIHTQQLPEPVVIPNKRLVTLAYQQEHPIYPYVAALIEKLLAKDGIRLKIIELSYEDIILGKQVEKIDIWLNGMSLGSTRSDAILSWLHNFDHIQRVMPTNEFKQLQLVISEWRSTPKRAFPSDIIGQTLSQTGQTIPLFHNWLGVDDSVQLQGMESNLLGWFDFKSVWSKPQNA